MKLEYWKKYKLGISKFKNGTSFDGDPAYPNGLLLAIIAGHSPMAFQYFRFLTFEEEIKVIKKLLKYGRDYERYPLIAELGQVCIYKNESYVYDTILGGSVIEYENSFDGRMDEKDEKPIMVLPSEDMLGILEDYNRWKLEQANNNVT